MLASVMIVSPAAPLGEEGEIFLEELDRWCWWWPWAWDLVPFVMPFVSGPPFAGLFFLVSWLVCRGNS